ncbi:hypothetical protein DPMN_134572, partial [Dreissena polymorpha]
MSLLSRQRGYAVSKKKEAIAAKKQYEDTREPVSKPAEYGGKLGKTRGVYCIYR